LSHAISENPTNNSTLNLINDGLYHLIKRAKIDSGADENVAKTADNLVESTVYKFQQEFESCNGNVMKSTHIGDMNKYVTNVRVIPTLTSDLVSTKKLQAKECAILMPPKSQGGGAFIINSSGSIVGSADSNMGVSFDPSDFPNGQNINQHYQLPFHKIGFPNYKHKVNNHDDTSIFLKKMPTKYSEIHTVHSKICPPESSIKERINHLQQCFRSISKQEMKRIAFSDAITNFPVTKEQIQKYWTTENSFHQGTSRKTSVLEPRPPVRKSEKQSEVLHSFSENVTELDSIGPIFPMSINKTTKIMAFMDRDTDMAMILFTHTETTETYVNAIDYIGKYYTKYGRTLKVLRSDSIQPLPQPFPGGFENENFDRKLGLRK